MTITSIVKLDDETFVFVSDEIDDLDNIGDTMWDDELSGFQQQQQEELGDRMKSYEKIYQKFIPNNKHMMVRLDGHKFSKFTKKLEKPFDNSFHRAMVDTTKDLVETHGACFGYTQSDEITLVFRSMRVEFEEEVNDKFEHIFLGRTDKVSSVLATYATNRFIYHLMNNLTQAGWEVEKLTEYIFAKTHSAHFDGRTFGVPTHEAVNGLIFRSRDGIRNSKQAFAQAYLSHKELLNLNSDQQIVKCKEVTNHDWNTEISDALKYGVSVKREKYMKVIEGYANATCQRTRVTEFVKDYSTFSTDFSKVIFRKFLEE